MDEIHIVKENYDSEVAARQAAESHAARLKAELLVYHQSALFGTSESIRISREEITQLSHTKADLEKTCNELRLQRDALVSEISNTTLRYDYCSLNWFHIANIHIVIYHQTVLIVLVNNSCDPFNLILMQPMRTIHVYPNHAMISFQR